MSLHILAENFAIAMIGGRKQSVTIERIVCQCLRDCAGI